jgi:hypothetical protein
MTAQAITPETLPAIVWQNQPVITTELLAEIYGTAVDNIQKNFERNASRFVEGVHYYLLKGADLKAFKANRLLVGQFIINKFTKSLYLWTERGTVRHAKILDTDNAWAVQEKLEDFYFSKKQPLQYGLKDHINEPLKIIYATKEQREIVVKAVRKFTIVAQSKGRSISFEEAHDMVNLRLGIRHIDKMTVEQIPDALQAVGQMLERVIFEGEYIAKGEAEPVQAEPIIEEPKVPFSYKDRDTLARLVNAAVFKFQNQSAWTQAIHAQLREITGIKSPATFNQSDKPAMAKELARLFNITDKMSRKVNEFEKQAIKMMVSGNVDLEPIFAEMEADYQAQLAKLSKEFELLLPHYTKKAIEEFAA